jgi:hypothetical protein
MKRLDDNTQKRKAPPPFVEKISTVFHTFGWACVSDSPSQSLFAGDASEFFGPQSFPFIFQIEQALIDPSAGDAEQSSKVRQTQ